MGETDPAKAALGNCNDGRRLRASGIVKPVCREDLSDRGLLGGTAPRIHILIRDDPGLECFFTKQSREPQQRDPMSTAQILDPTAAVPGNNLAIAVGYLIISITPIRSPRGLTRSAVASSIVINRPKSGSATSDLTSASFLPPVFTICPSLTN